jgi:hypothetical protein
MKPEELIAILENQKENLLAYVSLNMEKQKAIVSCNYEMLESCIPKEEHILVSIRQAEKLRVNALGELYKQFSITSSTFKLQEFIEKTKNVIGKNTAGKILVLEREIKEAVVGVININQQNRYLIEQSQSFIKETIQSILDLKKSLFDRRV